MIHYLANLLTIYLHKNHIIQQDLPIYQYGLELGISTTLGVILVLVMAAVMHDLLSGIIFLCAFLLLRSYTGGYHCSTYFRCNLAMVMIYGSYGLLAVFVGGTAIFSIGLNVIALLGIYVIMRLAPMDHINKPLVELEKSRSRGIAIAIASVVYLLGLAMQILHIKYYIANYYILIMTAILLVVSKQLENKQV